MAKKDDYPAPKPSEGTGHKGLALGMLAGVIGLVALLVECSVGLFLR